MNISSFILGGLAGGFICNLFGMLFYGVLFSSFFPESGYMNMTFILLGGFAYGFFISYILNKWSNITNWKTGLSAGLTLGLFNGIIAALYGYSNKADINYTSMFLEVLFSIIYTALTAAAIAIIAQSIDRKNAN